MECHKVSKLIHTSNAGFFDANCVPNDRLKWGVAALMTAINVSVFIVWIPARLQISESFINCTVTSYHIIRCLSPPPPPVA